MPFANEQRKILLLSVRANLYSNYYFLFIRSTSIEAITRSSYPFQVDELMMDGMDKYGENIPVSHKVQVYDLIQTNAPAVKPFQRNQI